MPNFSLKRILNLTPSIQKIYLEEILKGNLSFDINALASLIKTVSNPQISFLMFKILKKFSSDLSNDLISEIFGLTKEEVKQFKQNRAVEFEFPVVCFESNLKTSKLIKGYFVPLEKSNKKITNLENIETYLNHPLIKNSGFILYFNESFSGDSFLAPLYAALKLKKKIKKLIFSGSLDIEGNIVARFTNIKKEITKNAGKTLITEGNIQKIIETLEMDKVNFPLVLTTVTDDKYVKILSKAANIDLNSLSTLSNLMPENNPFIISFLQNLPEGSWKNFVTSAVKAIQDKSNFLNQFYEKVKFSLGLRTPSALAIGIGASVGSGKIPLTLYHYELGHYYKAIDLSSNSRKIKKITEKFETLDVSYKSKQYSKSCVVVIQLASHQAEGKALNSLVKTSNSDLIVVKHKKDTGALPLEENWEKIVSEIYSFIGNLQKEYSKIYLVLSTPVVIAFALGMALENYWNIDIYHYFFQKNKYGKILNLSELKLLY